MKFDNRINYSIDSIERSIVADNPISKKYSDAQKKKLYQQQLKMLDKHPGLKKMISLRYIYKYPIKGIKNWGRIGIVPPEIIISDDRIKDRYGEKNQGKGVNKASAYQIKQNNNADNHKSRKR